jgi:hypothetical protein
VISVKLSIEDILRQEDIDYIDHLELDNERLRKAITTNTIDVLERIKEAIQPDGLINSQEGINTIKAITYAIEKLVITEKEKL